MRFAGYSKGGNVDNLMTSEQLDQKRRLAWLDFKGAMDKAIVAANKEVLGKVTLTRESFLRRALTPAQLRADYLQKGIEIGATRAPGRDQVAALGEARKAFEETSAVFEALERIIERGYVDIPRE
jgi:hypothetical protein